MSDRPGLYSARPTLELDGQIQTELSERIRSLVVDEDTEGLFRAEITFENFGSTGGDVGFLYFDRQLLDFGKSITIRIGAGDAAGQVFQGRISALEGRYPRGRPPEILVLAEDRLQDLRMTRRTRTFDDVTDAELFEQIARDHGLTPDVDIDGPTHRVVAQVNQSDLAFLRDRARVNGAEIWVRDATLYAKPRTARGEQSVSLRYGERLVEFAASADLAHQRTRFSVSGWDVDNKQQIEESADSSVLSDELGSRQSGSAILGRALSERTERAAHYSVANADEARAIAEASYRAIARRFVTGRGLAEGDGRIQAGSTVDVAGVGTLFDGPYAVVAVQHRFDLSNGLRTAFSVERPGVGQ